MKRFAPYALIAVAAFAVWAPSLAIPAPGDNFGYDLEWSTQFSRLVLAGHAWPRWMPASFDGLGSPAFYFYPPLPFFVVAAISGMTGGVASAALQLKLAGLVCFAISGGAMFAWLRTLTTPAKALIGAILYMAAPYHFDDHFVRGDLAEFAAFALLPLTALGLRLTADTRRTGPLVLALSYAALIGAHLPLALLASVMLIGPYGLFMLWRAEPRHRLGLAARLAAGLALGIGLAAGYLAPALSLQSAVSADYWWSAKFHPTDGLFINAHAWSTPLLVLLAATALVEGALAAAVVFLARREAETLFWAGAALGVLALMIGVAPPFWSLPMLSQVQFPWRALALEEFALVTALAAAARLAPPRLALLGAALVLVNPAVLPTLQALAPHARAAAAPPPPAQQLYTPEYLPAGMLKIVNSEPVMAVGFDTLAHTPLASGPGLASATADPATGAVSVTLASEAAPRLVTLRRFYFPSWSASCDGRPASTAPVSAARLVGFVAPAGARTCEAHVDVTPAEKIGAAVAWASLVLLGLLTAALWRRVGKAPEPAPVS